LLVHGDGERLARERLEAPRELRDLARFSDVAREQNDASHAALRQLGELRARLETVEADGEEACRSRLESRRHGVSIPPPSVPLGGARALLSHPWHFDARVRGVLGRAKGAPGVKLLLCGGS